MVYVHLMEPLSNTNVILRLLQKSLTVLLGYGQKGAPIRMTDIQLNKLTNEMQIKILKVFLKSCLSNKDWLTYYTERL